MSDNRVTGFGKDPLAPSHGESLADQSFQSLKSKEIRDSMSPTEMKFQSMALNNPSNTGWNVQSSSEVSPDGRGFRAETIATTDGVENINGGTAEFKGRNEQRSSAMHEGDDKNFLKKASESSNTHLQEKVVVGDENSGRTEIRTSSSTSTSSSKVFQSSSTTEYENGQPVDHHPQYLMDSNRGPQRTQQQPQQQPQRMYEPSQGMPEPQYQQRPSQYEPQYDSQQEVRRSTDAQQQQQYSQQTEQYNRNRHETNTSQNVQTNETHEQNKRYVDMDKASPEYQKHVQYLMSQPGEVISSTVEYPKPNVKMITTVKRLPDGTIVRNKRYETEDTTPTPTPAPSDSKQTTSNTNTQRRDSQTHQQPKNYQGHPPAERLRRPNDDVVDNVETTRRHTHDDNVSNVETKYSTVKTSNRKFSTETTSETIQECDDGYHPSGAPGAPGASRPRPVTNDFSTQGFPSVRPNKPTQEFATDRPQSARPNQASPSQNMTSPRDALIPTRGEFEPTVIERRIPTEDGEVIIISSEKKRSVKHHTNSERIIETDVRSTDDNRYQQISDVTTSTNTTHGFPSVKEPQAQQPNTFPDLRQVKPHADTPGYPANARPSGTTPAYAPSSNDDGVVVTSQKSHSTKYNTNTERIIETEILGDDGRPIARVPADVEYINNKYTVTTPGGDQVPQYVYPGTTKPSPSRDYSTQGFPSVRSPTKGTPDYSTQGFPSTRDSQPSSVRSPTKGSPDYSTQGFPSARDGPRPNGTTERPQSSPVKAPTPASTTKKPSSTIETTERVIMKEKEVDAAHRAFAASLRSSSPVDQSRRDSYSTDGPRHTPRSSVSSTKTFRRDVREGSHDSDTSRVSSNTVTRQTPPRTVGGKTVVVTERITSSPRGTKSPSPGKTVTTTTTTRTVTSKTPVRDVPKSEPSPRSSPAPSSRSSPYPSKSKSPPGEDDQTVKTHTSRPLSPSFTSSRSPQPIGSKDVPNSTDHHPHAARPTPANVVVAAHPFDSDDDERRTVDREATFEQIDKTTTTTRRKPSRETTPTPKTTNLRIEDDVFVTDDDYLQEDVDANTTQSVKTKTKQLIRHEKEPVPSSRAPKPGMVRTTKGSPHETQRIEIEVTKRTDRSEEIKRPKQQDHTSPSGVRQQPLGPKTSPKTQQSPKGTPTPTQTPRKSLTQLQPKTAPKTAMTKPTELSPERGYPYETDIPSKATSKPQHGPQTKTSDTPEKKAPIPRSGYPAVVEPIISKSTQKPIKPQHLPQSQPRKSAEAPNTPRRGSPERKSPQSTPSKSNESPRGQQPQSPQRSNEIPKNKTHTPYIPRNGSPDGEYPSEEEPTTTKSTQKPVNPESKPRGSVARPYIPRSGSPDGEYPSEEEPTTTKSTQKPTKPRGSVERTYIPRSDSPECEYPSANDDESITENIRETSVITIQTSNKDIKNTQKQIDILIEDDYTVVDDQVTEAKLRPQQPGTDKPTDREPKTTNRSAQQQPKFGEPEEREPSSPGAKEPISYSPKTSRPNLYETTAQKLIRNDETEYITQKNITSNIHEKFMDAERTNPQAPKTTAPQKEPTIIGYPDEKEPSSRFPQQQQPKTSEPFQKEPKTTGYPHDKEPSSRYPQQQQPESSEPMQREPKIIGYPEEKEPSFRSPQQKPTYEFSQREPKFTDDSEPASKFPKQQPGDHYEPSQKEPKTTGYPDDKKPVTSKLTETTNETTIHEQFMEAERTHPERPDGAFISKAPEEPSPYPTYAKKGAGRRDTFEDRCRQILGMENYGDTPGAYKKHPLTEVDVLEEEQKNIQTKREETQRTTIDVKIEDCDDDDEPLSINSVKKNLVITKTPKSDDDMPQKPKPATVTTTKDTVYVSKKRTPDTASDSEPEAPHPTESDYETIDVTMKRTEKSDINVTKSHTSKSPTRPVQPIYESTKRQPIKTDTTPKSTTKKSPEEPQRDKPKMGEKYVTTTTEEVYISGVKKPMPDTTSDSEPETLRPTETSIGTIKKPTSASPTRSVSPTYGSTKVTSYETIEEINVTKKPSSRSPTRSMKPQDKEPYDDIPRTVDPTPESSKRQPTKVDSTQKPTAKKPHDRVPSDDIPKKDKEPMRKKPNVNEEFISTEKIYATKVNKESPDTDSESDTEPETVDTNETTYETIEVTNKRTEKSNIDITMKQTSRSVSPTYETIEVTHVTKKPSSKSPTRSVEPSTESPRRQPTTTTKKPQDKEPFDEFVRKGSEPMKMKPKTSEEFITTEKVYVTKVKKDLPDTTSDSEPEQCVTKETTQKTIEVTNKRTEKSNADITKKQTSRSPARSVSPTYASPIEVTKTTHRSPTRSAEPTSGSPKRQQPTKADSTQKPSAKKPQDKEPYDDIPRKGKEPLKKKPNMNKEYTSTGSVYVTKIKKELPDTASDSEPETLDTRQTSYQTIEVTNNRTEKSNIDITKKQTSKSPIRSKSPSKVTPYETIVVDNVTKKPSSKSPTRSVSPTKIETIEVTNKRVDKSRIDVTKKPSSRSPTRSLEPTKESPKRQPTKTDSTKNPLTKKPEVKEPLRKNPNANETFITTEKVYVTKVKKDMPDTTSDSEPETLETSYETIEVTNRRVDKSQIDITKKTTSRSPTRSVPEMPKRQPIKKIEDKEPYGITPQKGKEPLAKKKPNVNEEFITTEKVHITGVKKGMPVTTTDSETEQITYETLEVTRKRTDKDIDTTKKPATKTPTKSSPITEKPKRTPAKTTASQKQTVKDDRVTETTSIKDRLRQSTRKEKSPKKPDQVDAGSSPDSSPTRHTTERRRSSNISVNTEIIIEHTESEAVGTKKPAGSPRKPKDSVFKEIIDSTTLPDKLPRKMPVTERKESAPVHRVTRKDKDSKMSRSTSENLIKVTKKPETTPTTLTPPSPKMSPKPSADHRRPNKCFATKTINLSTTDRLMTSEDMENVIIDIQHAKSSREPSPDKIVPTPVPAHFDTGKPRYPDVVQEPEDEPRKKPVIKNIPIFEEEHNTYVGCHITEVNRKTFDREDDLFSTPLVEAPPSLDYPTSEKSYPTTVISDDECLLSVHDKVTKFQHIAEEVKKPKTSSPFHREYDDTTRVPDNDECLLTVDEKVDRFIKTAENLTNQPITPTQTRDTRRPPFIDETDEDLETTECPFTTVKLAPSEPQRSPELVRHISRHISRQSDVGEPTERPEPTKHTHETHEEYVSNRTTTTQEFVTHQQTSAVKQRPLRPVDHDDDRNDNHDYNNDDVDDDDRVVYVDDDAADDDDNEELIPHTATHTIRLEERRQKDILTRPSVFDNNSSSVSKKQPTGVGRVNKTQPKYVSPTPKDSEKSSNQTRQRQPTQPTQTRPQVKSRAKPEIPKQTPKVAATGATTVTTTTTTTTTSSTGKRQPQSQSPQQRRVPLPDTDCDYRSGSNVVETKTSVISSTTNKQTTKPYSINGPKKSPQPVSVPTKKRPEKQSPSSSHSPLHINKTKNLKHDDVDYEEFEVEVVPNDSETELIINSDTARRSTTTKTKATTNKTTTATGKTTTSTNVQQPHSTTTSSPTSRKMKEIPPGSTSPSSSSSSPPSPNKSTRAHQVVNLTERSTLLKHNTTTKSSETNESFLENRPPTKKTPVSTPYPHHKTKPAITTTDSVAARRSLFENHNSPKPLGKRPTPTSSPSMGRRPSYMDHTKSSLEHIRRDSLEVNKTNYSRRPSGDDYDEGHFGTDRNTQVKFDVPQKLRQEVLHVDGEEDINIEEIFELVILERLLETVTSYELRRRIRAQIRLVKKNLSNVERSEQSNVPERVSSSSDSKTKTTTASQVTTTTKKQQQYYCKEEHEEEERRTTSSTHTSPDRSQTLKVTKVSRTQSPESRNTSSIPSDRSLSPQQRPSSQTRVCSRQHDRSPSPASKVERKEFSLKETTKKQYIDDVEQVDHMEKIYKESSPRPRRPKQYYPIEDDEEVQQVIRIEKIRKESSPMSRRPKQDLPEHESEIGDERNTRRPSRKSVSPRSSPERQQVDNQTETYPRSGSPNNKKPTQPRVCSKSPENKAARETPNARMEQTVTTLKQQQKRAPAPSAPKTKQETKTPVWADRKNVLKTPSSTSPTTVRKPTSVSDSRTSSSLSRTVKSSTNQKHSTTNKSSYVEDDCITSSYGIGPTDENGLPLFGIRALKKKKPSAEPCETTEEVTGYVVEEKYYSDNKSKPIVERKELIYSTNPEELKAIKEKVKDTTAVKSIKSDRLGYDEEDLQSNNATYKTKTTTSVRSSPEEFLESSTTKYVRRGSVKEMSEKFIHKESASSVTEKTNNYPKAGLILRTNSRKQSRDNNDNMEGENIEYCESRTTVHRDSEEDDDYQVGVSGSDHFIVESESETESIKKTQREFKKVTSTKSSSSRSFLNTKGEQKLVTSVDDVLDRMRNADNVVEAGDTAEDQEARALLNKFLGASIIMKGVESTIPINRETKIITTTTKGSGKQPAKHEVTTTRVTKSIKSGSSSSPVTETTCDIEEIWDEEILKQLLEQAKTYEERRKIRSRLRELMADRADAKQQSSTSTTEKTETKGRDGAVVTTTTKVTTRTVSGTGPKTVSPFAKFKQLDRQNSQQSTKSPTTPTTPGGGSSASPSATGNATIFKFTDPALNARAATVKDQLLQWCQSKTKEYENVQITNFSASWVDGLAFCALIHHFLPDAFDYSQLTPQNRRKNFELAFTVADEKAGIAPLLDVEDMVVMKRPDWKCVFVYVQSIYRRFRNCQ